MADSNRRHALRGAVTLVELLVIVAGIALVAVLIVPGFVGQTCTDGGTEHSRSLVRGTENDAERFKLHCGRYPAQLDELLVRPSDADIAAKWQGPYVRRVPTDRWGSCLGYVCPGRHNPQTYDLWSFGADRTSGTSDDITNWD